MTKGIMHGAMLYPLIKRLHLNLMCRNLVNMFASKPYTPYSGNVKNLLVKRNCDKENAYVKKY